ncbi:MAG: PSD1 and planctomycete cytochrome C domain-containing protein [Verrucomicrobiota bacterium]
MRDPFIRWSCLTGLLSALTTWATASDSAAPTRLQFNRDIRPILSENCFVCHGPDKNHRKGKLRLDGREHALEREAFVPGQPDASELIKRIITTNEEDVMPPPDSHKTLSVAQKELLKRWIAEGAEYQMHWAYLKPVRPAIPEVQGPRSKGQNPIDAFVRAELEKRNITPSPEADRRTLLRRLSLDLTGLPPTPEEVEAFLKDTSSRAYEKQVERLLASPRFGERMAAPWLDVVRYADTVGYHGDQNQRIFPYRDYVINAFNQNKPFDQFTIEQIAGDLLPNATTEQKVASGFNRLNMMTREGGAQPKEYLAKYAADRVRTVSGTWLGSTMGCAECHDHKYDPISTKDFYQMAAFFADLKQWGVYMDYGFTPNPDLKGWSNEHPFPPEIEVASPYLQRRIAKLQAQIAAIVADSMAKLKSNPPGRAAFAEWQTSSHAFLKQWPSGWFAPKPEVVVKMVATNAPAINFTVRGDATVTFIPGARDETTLTLPLAAMKLSALRLEIVPSEDLVMEVVKNGKKKKRNSSAIILSASLKAAKGGKETKLTFVHAEADQKEERYANGAAILGVKDVWQISPDHDLQTAVWLLDRPIEITAGDTLVVTLGAATLASARVSVSPFGAGNPLLAGGGKPLRQALAKSVFPGSAAKRDLLNQTYLLSTAWDAAAFAKTQKLFAEVRECREGRAFTMVTEAREPVPTRVLPRGNWQDETGEIVAPAPPHFLPAALTSGPNRLTRLDLAQWLVSSENPLTARTVMNRFWKEFFGRGLSPVVDDLGGQGEPPSHPELLDWLACEFMQPTTDRRSAHNWDVKHMVKLMVMSATYRQSANQRPELKDIDPSNRLLAAQNPRRLEAEFVRDNALFIAGLLNEDLGGPSAFPYQPGGYYANLQFPDRNYRADRDERQYRRGLYSHWQRAFLQPMLANFDAPAREECTAARVVSNTPQQALTLLNDPAFVESSRAFAGNVLAAKARSDEERIDLAFQRALARPAKITERASLVKFLAAQRGYYGANPSDTKKFLHVGNAATPAGVNESELAAWTQVCRVVLNLHETITRY